jgi:NIPSNAP
MSEPRTNAETAVPVIEIRTFRLVPGGKEAFDRVAHRVLPMLKRYGIRVVACEPSADSDDHYVLIRAFSSAAERDEQLGAFYGSDEWHEKYRDSVLDLIESYHVVAVELTASLAEALSALAALAKSQTPVEESTSPALRKLAARVRLPGSPAPL